MTGLDPKWEALPGGNVYRLKAEHSVPGTRVEIYRVGTPKSTRWKVAITNLARMGGGAENDGAVWRVDGHTTWTSAKVAREQAELVAHNAGWLARIGITVQEGAAA